MLQFYLYKISQKIAVSLPIKIIYSIAVFFSDLHRIFSRADRLAVEANLKTVFPNANKKTIDRYNRETFHNFAKYLVDFLRFEKIDKNYIEKNIAISGIEKIDKALLDKTGIIIVSAHIANWELAGIAMALLGYPIACVALSHRNEQTNKFFINQRKSKGMEVLPLGSAAFKCFHTLKKNKLLALVGDRDFTQAGITIDFFSTPTLIPRGPAAFSLKTNAPIVAGILIRQDDDTFKFVYEGPIEIERSGDTEQDVRQLTEKYIRIFENYIRAYPGQWLMFRRFWEPVTMASCG